MLPDTARDRFKKTLQYLQYTKADYTYLEKNDVKWVSLDTVIHCLNCPEHEGQTRAPYPLQALQHSPPREQPESLPSLFQH